MTCTLVCDLGTQEMGMTKKCRVGRLDHNSDHSLDELVRLGGLGGVSSCELYADSGTPWANESTSHLRVSDTELARSFSARSARNVIHLLGLPLSSMSIHIFALSEFSSVQRP